MISRRTSSTAPSASARLKPGTTPIARLKPGTTPIARLKPGTTAVARLKPGTTLVPLLVALALVLPVAHTAAQQPRRRPAAPPTVQHFKTTMTADQMKGKQAVVETAQGTFVIQLLPEAAPNHVGYVIKLAREGAYDGTTFHRAIKYGVIQGGDPLSKDPVEGRAVRYRRARACSMPRSAARR